MGALSARLGTLGANRSQLERLVVLFGVLWLAEPLTYLLPGEPHDASVWRQIVGIVVLVVLAVFMLRRKLWAAVVATVLSLAAVYIDAHLIVVDYGATPRVIAASVLDGLALVTALFVAWMIWRPSEQSTVAADQAPRRL